MRVAGTNRGSGHTAKYALGYTAFKIICVRGGEHKAGGGGRGSGIYVAPALDAISYGNREDWAPNDPYHSQADARLQRGPYCTWLTTYFKTLIGLAMATDLIL